MLFARRVNWNNGCSKVPRRNTKSSIPKHTSLAPVTSKEGTGKLVRDVTQEIISLFLRLCYYKMEL